MENKSDLYNQEVEQYVIYYATKDIEKKDLHYLSVMFDRDHSPLDKKRTAILNEKEKVEFSVIENIIENIEDSEQALWLFKDVFPARNGIYKELADLSNKGFDFFKKVDEIITEETGLSLVDDYIEIIENDSYECYKEFYKYYKEMDKTLPEDLDERLEQKARNKLEEEIYEKYYSKLEEGNNSLKDIKEFAKGLWEKSKSKIEISNNKLYNESYLKRIFIKQRDLAGSVPSVIDVDKEITENFKNTKQIVSFFENVYPIHEPFYYDMKPTGAHERMAEKIKRVFQEETGYKTDFQNESVKEMFENLNEQQKKVPLILSYHFREPTSKKNHKIIYENKGDYHENFHKSIGKRKNKFF